MSPLGRHGEGAVSAEVLQRLAFTDPVTRLPNQMAMLRTLEQAAENNPGFLSFLSIGIEEFVSVTDAFGFDASNRLARAFAARLEPLPDTVLAVARIGQAEFGVLLSGTSDEYRAGARCRKISRELQQSAAGRVDLGNGIAVDVTLSMGGVLWARSSTERSDAHDVEESGSTAYPAGSYLVTDDASEVLASAELARKRARVESGLRRMRFFDADMQHEARQRVELVTGLRRALEREEFVLYSQPIVDRDRRVLGEEALIRWERPGSGLMAPDAFIPLAEQTGLIFEIGAWVLEEACRTLAAWARDPVLQQVRLAVNLSARQFRSDGFADTVAETMQRHGVPAGRLAVELTEGVLEPDFDRAIELLGQLRDLGVPASLDDFGSGYSSLNRLASLPVQQLKIDRAFVEHVAEDERAAAIVETIVRLGHIYGMQTVAEGVETEAQFSRLRDLNVDAFQGYLFSLPRPISDVGPGRG